jgi:hypothetical protein
VSKTPYYIRHIDTNATESTDGIWLDKVGEDTARRISVDDFVSTLPTPTPTFNYNEVTTTYTILTTDYTVNCTSGTFTVTLPTAAGIEGQIFVIMNSGSGLITLEGTGAETIQGDLFQEIFQDESFTVQSTGSNYIVI